MKATTGKVVRQVQGLGLDKAKLNTILAGGTIEGTPRETLRKLKEEVRKAAIDGKIVTVNARTGVAMTFKPDYYAEMVFQTKLAETTNIATVQRLQARKVSHVKIIGSNSRNFCTAFVGRVFYIGEGADPLSFPHVRDLPGGGPPFHPCCTKRYTAFIAALATAEQVESGRLLPNERELLNSTSSDAQRKHENPSKPAKPKRPVVSAPPPPRPTVPVAERLQGPSRGKLADALKSATKAVDKLHGIEPASASIPVKLNSSTTYNGLFSYKRYSGAPVGIQISTNATAPRMTLLHEIGHWMDLTQFGKADQYGTTINENFAKFRAAVKETRAVKTLQALSDNPLVALKNGRSVRVPKPYVDYLLQTHEVWARAYAQYIAIESGDPVILQELNSMRESDDKQPVEVRRPRQWTDEDFEPIRAVIKGILFDLRRSNG
ncbi:MAG TPA: hypothetical protein VGB55_01230 [Tepidisphaeraceae bacterium]